MPSSENLPIVEVLIGSVKALRNASDRYDLWESVKREHKRENSSKNPQTCSV